MSSPIQSQATSRAGLCPHGLPPSACPICNSSSMAGGGRIKDTSIQRTTKTSEWSWMKCYAVGMAMKANEARIENAKNAFEKQIEFAQQLKDNIQQITDKIKNLIENIQKSMPTTVGKFLGIISNTIIFPILKLINIIPKIIEKFAHFQKSIANFMQQVTEKITALLGDLKNFLERNFIETTKKKIKKFFLFFTSDIEDENYENDDTLAIFKARELKKLLVKIISSKKENKEDADRSNKSK